MMSEETNRRTVEQATSSEDVEAPPGLHLKVMLIRLRIEMSAAARALQGELRDEFWQLVDDLQAMRPKRES